MRIVCQKCSAAYAIDDKLVTPKGIRAQCPRCRHLQLVKQGEGAPAITDPAVPAPSSPQSSAPFDFSGDFSFSDPAPPAVHTLGSTPGYKLKPRDESMPPPGPPSSRPNPGAAAAAPSVKCKTCGKVLTDPFDQALGV